MVADVPVGAFLSGGVDSNAIVALMNRHATGSAKTFSLGFTVGGAYNELSDARAVAEHLGTEHHELRVEHTDLVETLRTLVYHYDEPFGDPACFPLYLLSRFAREHVKVVLSGDGGDELFGGYRRYAMDRFAPLYQRLPAVLTANFIPALAGLLPRFRRIKRALQTLPIADPARRYAAWLVAFTPRDAGRDAASGNARGDRRLRSGMAVSEILPPAQRRDGGGPSEPLDVCRCENLAGRRLHGKS
jgi:asparagine synthase (glutamine-hydrolysing)